MKKIAVIVLFLIGVVYEVNAVKVSMNVPAVVLLGGGELVTVEV